MVVRTSELKNLEAIYEKDRNSLTVLYGSIRSEKEALIRNFCKDKKVFYYRARNASTKEQLSQLKAEVEKQYDIHISKDEYDECFRRVRSGDASKLIVVIDDFQLIARKDSAFYESIVRLRDRELYPGPVMILLCNSSVAWTLKEMDETLGSLSDKIDYRIKLKDVTFLDVVRTFPSFSVKQSVEAYGVLGGVPAYLNMWDAKKSTRQNIIDLMLKPTGAMFGEADTFISSELRELSVYSTILASIARGNEKLNDLYNDTGYSRAKISVYMKNLAAFDVIEKVVSFETGGWQNAKKGVYRVSNNYINFYFRFIYPHLSDLFLMEADEFYDTYIAGEIDTYLRRYFVDVCYEYLELINMMGKAPIKIKKMGTWVGKTGTIDIIGQDEARNTIVGICNFEEEELKFEQYENLLASMKQARISATAVFLFSAKAFDSRLTELAETDDKVVLVDMTEL